MNDHDVRYGPCPACHRWTWCARDTAAPRPAQCDADSIGMREQSKYPFVSMPPIEENPDAQR